MYRCLDCGRVFSQPRRYQESYGESWDGCPRCAGAYETVIRCGECDNWMSLDEDALICEECQRETVIDLGKLIEDNFPPNCAEWIYSWVEATPLQDAARWKELARPGAVDP